MGHARFSRLAALALGAALVPITGCDLLSKAQGFVEGVSTIQKNLEEDVKSELTDDKIDQVLEVTPRLLEFQKEAEVKWKPDPRSGDIAQLTAAIGGLGDYAAFFESEGTRITEYYVDLLKIHDARTQIHLKKAREQALKKLDDERKELEARLETAEDDADQAALEKQLERNRLARKNVDQAKLKRSKAKDGQKNTQGGYTLSDAELGSVRDRITEIDQVFEKAGWGKGTSKTEAEAAD